MLARVEEFIKEQGLLEKGHRVVIGVSGGPDSVALLHILWQLKESWDLKLIAAHVHHGLRPEADSELERLRQQCRVWGIKLESKRVDIARLAGLKKRSLEETGRIQRYLFFAQLMEKYQAQRIATAHHMDDNAESILLHLLRGSGKRGMRGILPRNENIIRPLLCVKKVHIMDYLQRQRIAYAWDASNMDVSFSRNRIRNELLPYLEEHFNPRLVEGLNRFAEISRHEDQWLKDLTARLWQEMVTVKSNCLELELEPFLKAPLAAQRRLILGLCSQLLGSEGWERSDVDIIVDFAREASGSSRYLGLKRGLVVHKVYGKLVFGTEKPEQIEFDYQFVVPGQIMIEETGDLLRCVVEKVKKPTQYLPQPGDTCLDWERLLSALDAKPPADLPLSIRSRLPGDRFIPPGASKSTKLKDYFIKAKVPWAKRNMIPLLASDRRVFAILGQMVDQDVQLSGNTAYVLVIKRERLTRNRAKTGSDGVELDNCIE